ncbi:MAG: ABC transporter permease [Betaproteobacteria bacterium]|nr:ABC transporter permease [Betaproteobacteria bacterium]NCA15893.1 ABC transporter permease [Betaproteobacteria bacterium]
MRPVRRQIFSWVGGALLSGAAPRILRAAPTPIRIGLMLPASGTFAPLGKTIQQGLRLALTQSGGQWGKRPVEFVVVDDESNPAKAPEHASRLLSRDRSDLLVGSVHSGVALGMAKVARDNNKLLIIPNAGANALTAAGCTENIFRTSFSNWQTIVPLGKVMADRGVRTAAFITWKYTAGQEYSAGFKEGFEAHGGRVVADLSLPFPQVEFAPLLTQIAAVKPQAVSCFFSGAGAAKFLLDYAQSGLKDKIPLFVTGHATEGILQALNTEAEGVVSVLHYADGLPHRADQAFRKNFQAAYGAQPDVFAVQGFDTGLALAQALSKTKGETDAKALSASLEGMVFDSPRGRWVMSKAHNPIQDIYVREVKGKRNAYIGIAVKALEDPATGCTLGS